MDPNGKPLTRRSLLVAMAGALGSATLASCGESSSTPSPPEALSERLARDLNKARAVSRTSVERRPQRRNATPQPNAQQKITVATLPKADLGWGNAQFFGALVNAMATARERSDRRYIYEDAALGFPGGMSGPTTSSAFSFSSALDAVAAAAPDLVLYLQIDHADLVANERLINLDPYLVSDEAFDPTGFWPNLLELGQHKGVQYGIPVAASPSILLFNRELAVEFNIKPPDPNALTFNDEVFLKLVGDLHMADPPTGGIGSLGMLSIFSPEPNSNGDYSASPAPLNFLLSATGDLRGPRDDFAPLLSDPAVEAARLLRAWVQDHQFAITDNRSIWPYFQQQRIGLFETYLAFAPLDRFASSFGSIDVYPFPTLGGAGHPAYAHLLVGVLAEAKNPDLAYDAMRYLAEGLRANAVLPAERLTQNEVVGRVPALQPEGGELVYTQMLEAVYPSVSRREVGMITNGILGDIVFGTASPEQGMRDIVDRLRELPSS